MEISLRNGSTKSTITNEKNIYNLHQSKDVPMPLLIEYILQDAVIEVIKPENDVLESVEDIVEYGFDVTSKTISSDALLVGCFGLCNAYKIQVFNNDDAIIYKLFNGMVYRLKAMGFTVE